MLRVRLMAFDGKVLSDTSKAVEVPALSSQVLATVAHSDLLKVGDLKQVFAVTDLSVGGKVVSSNLLLFSLPKEVAMPAAKISSELLRDGDGYRLRLSSPVLARSVHVSFGDVDAKLADDYFDLLPGGSREIHVSSAATADQLRAGMKVVSLSDAFAK
jgi:beta-mannosidase